jgi:hypothetical protein
MSLYRFYAAASSASEQLRSMPAIGNLQSQRRALTCTFGVAATSIASDDFRAGVGLQPS